ncbi:hypothetical protein MKK63_13370 [Methylobacterium sp. J-088]|uniref:hypothetical protein n=1 Tax=Methylobacterium sp. J-088 TaxID=2836664 RepID=UPI001FB991D4|nr:hypothetical protein [Methylobacterium sp. J-088]MCJ2063693.1 hypothetical protein [Methylobacterium sp. J-088]
MPPDQISMKDGALHIDGYPDAVKLIRLTGKKAKQLAHYAAHRFDLQNSKSHLNNMKPDNPEAVNDALWRSAISTYIKCFTGGAARNTKLRAENIYESVPVKMKAFQHFEHLRNKHFEHDENAYGQAIPCAAINGGGKGFKLEGVIANTLQFVTFDVGNYGNLQLLITEADQWIEAAFKNLADVIAAELERESLEELLGREAASITVPTVGQVGVRRPDDA